MLLLASIFFYISASAETFIIPVIIILSTFINGKLIAQASNESRKKIFFLIGLFVNLGLLIFFKYINFFIKTFFDSINFIHHFSQTGKTANQTPVFLQIVVPLGISYITFQAIGYLIEIHRGKQKPEYNLGYFATFILFFPKLLSGPIERGYNFLPQIRQVNSFNSEQIVTGFKRIIWGLFLKLVVADRLSIYTNAVFNNFTQHSGLTLLVASVFFTIQLYADFAGYTEMAIGSAQLLGYRLMENFDSPFIAKSVTEFWRRWHISLTTWVGDYIYNPIVIKFRNWNKLAVVFAIIVTFLILGFWHGASWNYIIFGFLQAVILSFEFLTRKLRKIVLTHIPAWIDTFGGICFTFAYFCFSTIFFKANTTNDALSIIKKIIFFSGPLFLEDPQQFLYCLIGITFVFLAGIHKIQNRQNPRANYWFKDQLVYSLIIILILLIGVFDGGQFIYFQF
jgi:D-alanyl-lipoteichoic acid acyltransferase DltB (MBOAT superfamily)